MPHMVVFRTNEGKPGYHLAETLDDAVRFVEDLRNKEQVSDSKVYRLHEVPIEFKVLYKVEVAGAPASSGSDYADATMTAPPGTRTDGAPTAKDRTTPVRAAAPTPVSRSVTAPVAQTGGRFGLFSRA